MPTHAEQVASVIHRSVQELLTRGLNDPRIQGLVSVTHVKVTDDLAEASISVSVIPEDRGPTTLKGLLSATGHIRSHVGKALQRRRIPKLRFVLDESLKKQSRVLEAISRVQQESEEHGERKSERGE